MKTSEHQYWIFPGKPQVFIVPGKRQPYLRDKPVCPIFPQSARPGQTYRTVKLQHSNFNKCQKV